jgi:DNA-binding transcriptional MerR regulator
VLAGGEYPLQNFSLTLDCTPECILNISCRAFTTDGQPTFQIGELAKRTDLTIDAIRFYERRKLLSPASRSTGRVRLYTSDAIERLRFVRRMQALGFSLQEIKELMGVRADRAHACSAVREFLKTKLADVAMRIRELQQLDTELNADLRKCNRALKQQRGKTFACPVLEGEERTSNA